MAEVMAQRASVEVLAGEIEAAGMAQRVRIDADGEFSADRLGEPLQHLAKIRRAPRRAALGHEHVHGVGILPAQLERSQRVLGRKSALCAPCRNRRGARRSRPRASRSIPYFPVRLLVVQVSAAICQPRAVFTST